MPCRKVLEARAQEEVVLEQLQYLYYRRSAVEVLIRSLENYEKLDPQRLPASAVTLNLR